MTATTPGRASTSPTCSSRSAWARACIFFVRSLQDGYWSKERRDQVSGVRDEWKHGTEKPKIKEYADGWITEREGTEIPAFLKLAYIVIAGGALAYFFLYMYGETTMPTAAPLVRADERGHRGVRRPDVRDRGA